jgi:hypothetical protein
MTLFYVLLTSVNVLLTLFNVLLTSVNVLFTLVYFIRGLIKVVMLRGCWQRAIRGVMRALLLLRSGIDNLIRCGCCSPLLAGITCGRHIQFYIKESYSFRNIIRME